MHSVDFGADHRAIRFRAEGGRGEVGPCGPGPLERVLEHVAAVHRAFQHAIADRGRCHCMITFAAGSSTAAGFSKSTTRVGHDGGPSLKELE